MNLVMKERNLSYGWCDAFGVQPPIAEHHRASPPTSRETTREMKGKRFWREWVAHRAWEDDGGSVGQDLRRVAR